MMERTIVLGEREDGWGDGYGHPLWVDDQFVGDLVWQPKDLYTRVSKDPCTFLTGWSVLIDHSTSPRRYLGNIRELGCFITGLSSKRSALRAALAQLDVNNRWAAQLPGGTP